MITDYEAARAESRANLVGLLNNENVCRSLNRTLPNSGEEIDYVDWREGCKRFLRSNETLLKEWARR